MPAAGIIDIHTHFATGGDTPSDEELATMRRLANRHGIARIVELFNFGPGARPSIAEVRTCNTCALRAMERMPDFVTGFCYLNPEHNAAFLRDETQRCIADGGMRGIKLWVAVKATDKRLDPVMERAAELDVPVLHHAWYKAAGQGEFESTPAEIADLARRHPRVTIVMAHLTGDGLRGVHDILDCPNVLIDTSGGQPEAHLVAYAVKRLGASRVIYGSDWPIRDFGTQVGRVAGAEISDADKALIFRGNAERILKLKESGA